MNKNTRHFSDSHMIRQVHRTCKK